MGLFAAVGSQFGSPRATSQLSANSVPIAGECKTSLPASCTQAAIHKFDTIRPQFGPYWRAGHRPYLCQGCCRFRTSFAVRKRLAQNVHGGLGLLLADN